MKDRLPPAAPAAKDPRRYGAVARSLIEHVKCVPISWSRMERKRSMRYAVAVLSYYREGRIDSSERS